MSFNTQPNEFYTILINGEQEWQFLFQEHSAAEKWIQERASWDCRPNGGDYSEWYDPKSGTTYKIVDCDDCGRF